MPRKVNPFSSRWRKDRDTARRSQENARRRHTPDRRIHDDERYIPLGDNDTTRQLPVTTPRPEF